MQHSLQGCKCWEKGVPEVAFCTRKKPNCLISCLKYAARFSLFSAFFYNLLQFFGICFLLIFQGITRQSQYGSQITVE